MSSNENLSRQTEHLNYFDQIAPADAPIPTDKKQITRDVSFRIHQNTSNSLPRMSPGAMVDDTYTPHHRIHFEYHTYQDFVGHLPNQPFRCSTKPTLLADPLEYRPQRWLPPDYPHYDPKFQNDDDKAFLPFNQGPRIYPGSAIAWAQTKLYLAKVLWTFNLEMVPGQDLSFDRDFTVYTMWNRPAFWVRFVPVVREKSL